MKKPKLGDVFYWKGQMVKVVATANEPTVFMETMENQKCPHCDGDIGKHQFGIIPTSPLFQENAEPIQTLENN